MEVSWLSCTLEKLLLFPAQRHDKAHFIGLLHTEVLTVRTNQLEVIRQIVLTLHNPHNQDISQMTFSLVVMRGPFVLNAHREGRLDLWRMAHKRLNRGITTKHFTDDLQPYQDNDSRRGLIYR